MKQIKGYIKTNKVGSTCEFEFEIEDDATPEEIEEWAKEAAFENIEWSYTINGEDPHS